MSTVISNPGRFYKRFIKASTCCFVLFLNFTSKNNYNTLTFALTYFIRFSISVVLLVINIYFVFGAVRLDSFVAVYANYFLRNAILTWKWWDRIVKSSMQAKTNNGK